MHDSRCVDYVGNGIFFTVAVLFFTPNQSLGRVLNIQKQELQKESGALLYRVARVQIRSLRASMVYMACLCLAGKADAWRT